MNMTHGALADLSTDLPTVSVIPADVWSIHVNAPKIGQSHLPVQTKMFRPREINVHNSYVDT